jgi:hypothetical protein
MLLDQQPWRSLMLQGLASCSRLHQQLPRLPPERSPSTVSVDRCILAVDFLSQRLLHQQPKRLMLMGHQPRRPLMHQELLQLSPLMALQFRIPLFTAVLQELFSTLHSPVQTLLMLFNRFVSSCMIHGNHTWLPSNTSLRYIRGTLHLGLFLRPTSQTELVVYSDADWAGCPDSRRSTSGYGVFFGDNLVSWSSKR